MFASIRRGFGFLGQAVDLARKDGDLLKPSFFGLIASAIVAVIGAIPIILVSVLAGGTEVGKYSLYVLGALVIFAQYATAYIFSGMTAYLVYEYLTEGDGRMGDAWRIVRRDGLHLIRHHRLPHQPVPVGARSRESRQPGADRAVRAGAGAAAGRAGHGHLTTVSVKRYLKKAGAKHAT